MTMLELQRVLGTELDKLIAGTTQPEDAKAQKEVGSGVTLVPKSWCRFRSAGAVDNE